MWSLFMSGWSSCLAGSALPWMELLSGAVRCGAVLWSRDSCTMCTGGTICFLGGGRAASLYVHLWLRLVIQLTSRHFVCQGETKGFNQIKGEMLCSTAVSIYCLIVFLFLNNLYYLRRCQLKILIVQCFTGFLLVNGLLKPLELVISSVIIKYMYFFKHFK